MTSRPGLNNVSRKKAALFRILNDYLAITISIVQGIVFIPLYLKFINPVHYGAWLATGSIVEYIGLFDFGLNAVLMQRISHSFGQKDDKLLGPEISAGLTISFVLSLMGVLGVVVISPFVPHLVNIHGGNDALVQAFRLAGLSTSLMIFNYSFSSILIGLQRTLFNGLAFNLATLVGLAVTLFYLLHGSGLVAIGYGLLARSLLYFCMSSLYVSYLLRVVIGIRHYAFRKVEFVALFKSCSLVFSSRVARTVSMRTDGLIIADVLVPLQTTIYTITLKLGSFAETFVSRISSAVMPVVANLHGEEKAEKVEELTRILFKSLALFAVVVLGGIAVFNGEFITLWVGEEYFAGNLLNATIVAYLCVLIGYSAVWNVVFGIGFIGSVATLTIIEAVSRVVLSIVLVHFFGLYGAPIAAMVSMLLPLVVLFNMKHSQLSAILGIFRKATKMWKYLPPLSVSVAVGLFWQPSGLIQFLACVLTYTSVSLGYLYFIERKFITGIWRLYFPKGQMTAIASE